MSTLYTIQSTDLIKDTFDDINSNFSALNTDKAEVTGKLSQFAPTTSAELASVISDETGSGGSLVFSNSPSLTTPSISAVNVSGGTVSFPTGASDTLVGRVSTDTFSTGVKTFLNGILGLRNVANTFTSFFTNTNTASRTYTLKDASGTLAFTTDITGVNSGTNTGDETTSRINTLYGTTNAITVGSVEVGHATDTTISRVSAGRIAVEGVNVVTISSTDTLTNKTLTSPTLTTPTLGTPTSGTLTSCTGLPISTGVSGLGTGVATFLATPSSANLATAITDETGTGSLVFGTKPTLNGFVSTITADTDGATITFNMAASNIHTVTLAGNRTLAVSNVSVGQCFMLRLQQDATGSRTVTWFTTLKWAGGSAPTLTTTANKADLIGFLCTSAGNYDAFVVASNI